MVMPATPDPATPPEPGATEAAPDRTLVDALRARLEDDTGAPVELVETHISWVLLTAKYAYKLKKPVRLGFVDFGTPAQRKRYCDEELRLNRRFAPSLYLRVERICGSPAEPRLGGPGEPFDHAVCMRRFPPGALLAERLAAGLLAPAAVERLALLLADFHRDADVAGPESPWGRPERVLTPVLDVLARLAALPRPADGTLLPALRDWVQAQWQRLLPVWHARQACCAIREGHGDLHLGNAVLFDDEVLPFDCIEFDPALRWIDVFSDLAFLTMDLRAHGRADLAWRALDTYLQRNGDFEGLRVLRFHEVYRALVREMVARLRALPGIDAGAPLAEASASAARAPDYLGCAGALAAQAPRARLLVMHGLSGAGKSRLGLQLAERAEAIRLRSDVERKRLAGLAPLQRGTEHVADLYSPAATRRTFERLAGCAREALLAGWPVIVDAAFLRRAERRDFARLAAELDVPFTILHCQADAAVLRQRVTARMAAGDDASDADLQVLQRQLEFHEPLEVDELVHTIGVHTDGEVDVAALAARWLAIEGA